jgi:hypothetical protein
MGKYAGRVNIRADWKCGSDWCIPGVTLTFKVLAVLTYGTALLSEAWEFIFQLTA